MIPGISWAFALANLKHDAEALRGWLCHRSFWQLVSMGLAIFALVQHFQIIDARHDAAAWQKNYTTLRATLDQADKAVKDAKAAIAKATKELKDRNDAENRRIADDARTLRLSGAGKASCRPVTSGSGGHGQGAAKPDAPRPPLPATDWAAVPWDWLVGRAEEHDQLLSEVETWRAWYAEIVKDWPK